MHLPESQKYFVISSKVVFIFLVKSAPFLIFSKKYFQRHSFVRSKFTIKVKLKRELGKLGKPIGSNPLAIQICFEQVGFLQVYK